jgi:hypothetical protein
LSISSAEMLWPVKDRGVEASLSFSEESIFSTDEKASPRLFERKY